ncbi:MAG TPA: putative baseplate assembly protein [Anaerolineae bacterium]|nr:putative baseplate assembly protein [Anaerolineae bacterium]
MTTHYHCKNEKRRTAVRETKGADGKPVLNGIDFLEVSADQATLQVHFIHNLPGQSNGVPTGAALTRNNVVIAGGVRVTDVRVASVASSQNILTVRVNAPGDFSTYALRLVTSPTDADVPPGFDPQLVEIEFSFKVDCPSDFDCPSPGDCPPENLPSPPIDYLAKDFASFRRLMLDRLAVTLPDWQERNPADVGVALVEVLAYAADQLSYYQDAVATEAYLGTARKRISIRRHAQLLDYPMHDGCNARVWACLEVSPGSGADDETLPASTPLLTQVDAPRGALAPEQLAAALTDGALAYETMHAIRLRSAHNTLRFYTWDDEACCLPKGATRATLRAEGAHITPGDVLIFEEVISPATGQRADADPTHRHAVRLTHVTRGGDPLHNLPVIDIEWHADDALPFPVCLSARIADEKGERIIADVSIARGNVVLADHGLTLRDETLTPETVPAEGRYRPHAPRGPLTYHASYNEDSARTRSAAAALQQEAQAALPALALRANGETWLPRRTLLNSDRFAHEFVVEAEDDGRARLRFGDGGLGRRPPVGLRFNAAYRIGNGRAGNIGAEAIAHIVTALDGITTVRNPLPAQNGTDPESSEQVRLDAPQAFRLQERAVTEADYTAVAQRHPEVQRAIATRRWTGSWHTLFVTVDRKGGRPVDAAFEAELRAFLERFRLAGYDLEIDGPRFAPLDIALTVCVAPGQLRSNVKAALLETFSNRDLPDGRRGFFHPDNWTFGQPVYLSPIIAAAMQAPGVLWVDADDTPPKPNRFQRYGQPAHGERAEGRMPLGRLEIARLDNDPSAPENGRLEFYMQGGL